MSQVYILASDIYLPLADINKFAVNTCVKTEDSFLEIYNLTKKKYCSELDLSLDDSYVLNLKAYLSQNLTPESEVELWSIWLGSDFSRCNQTKINLKHIPNDNMIYDQVDYYYETNFKPTYKVITLSDLNKTYISWLINKSGACIIIKV